MEQTELKYQTPPQICDYMVGMIPKEASTILEPTPGIGNIVRSLESAKLYNITAADNFFNIDRTRRYDCIVMNPPFSSKFAFGVPDEIKDSGMKLGYYILTECMKMSNNIIALMPWFTLSDSDVRLRFIKNYGLKSLTALPRKTFNYARIQTVIIELEKGYSKETIFRTLQ